MLKVHYQTDQEELLQACGGEMYQIFDDRLVKSAASDIFSKEALREYAPDKDHFMLHLVAMGDQETYGPNKNGDGFPRQSLEKYAKTFVTNGCFFREHRNRDQKTQGIGTVKAAAYNPDMHRVELIVHGHREKAAGEYEKAKNGEALSFSMSCFPSGTPVLRPDGSTTPIEELQVGDSVVTHHGRFGTISHTMSREYSGAGIVLRPYGLPEDLIATSEHPIWVRPTIEGTHECPVCGGRYKNLKNHLRQQKDVKHKAAYKDFPSYCEGFKRADLLVPGDSIRIPVPQEVKGDIDKDLAWLLGLYLAEGHVHRFSSTFLGKYSYGFIRLDLTLGSHEKELAEKARSILQRHTTNKVKVFQQNNRNVLKVRLTVREGKAAGDIINWLTSNGGHLGDQKALSQEALFWNPKTQRKIVEGWLDGDGSWSTHNSHASGVTTSERLAHHMQIILARGGISSTLSASTREGRKKAFLLQIPQDGSETLDFCRKPAGWSPPLDVDVDISHLNNQSEGTVVRSKKKATTLVYVDADNGHLYARLRYVRKTHLEERVYDLTVPGDHGFVAGGIGVSNCRVPYDECSICGHKAKKQADYCGHLKEGMLQYNPEFKKYAYAINEHPTFFDISVVAKPADRIAHYLDYAFPDREDREKAASVSQVITGTQWAEYEGVCVPDSINTWSAEKKATLDKLNIADAYFKNEEELAKSASVNANTYFANNVAPYAFTQSLSDEDVETLRTLEPGTLVSELSKRASLLPFPEFASWALGIPRSTVLEDKVVKVASMQLPDIISKLMAGGPPAGIADMFGGGGSVPSSDPVQQLMDKVEDRFAIKAEPTKRRVIQIITIKCASEMPRRFIVDHIDSVNSEEAAKAQALAEAYGIYKVASMSDIKRIHGDDIDDAQYLLAASQNRFIYH